MSDKLLVIDSVKFDRDIMARIFGGKYTLDFVTDVNVCSFAIREFMPEIVFFEMRLKKIKQLETVCEAIECNRPETKLIVSVTENNIDIERYAREKGVFYYMIRPFNLKELWDALEDAFAFNNKLVMNTEQGICNTQKIH